MSGSPFGQYVVCSVPGCGSAANAKAEKKDVCTGHFYASVAKNYKQAFGVEPSAKLLRAISFELLEGAWIDKAALSA